MHAASVDEIRSMVTAIAMLVMAVGVVVVVVVILVKGRSISAEWKDLKVTLNPQTMQQFSGKLDEVVKSVNMKRPEEPTLFQTVKLHTTQLKQVNHRLDGIDGKLDTKLKSLNEVNSKLDKVMHHVGLQETTTPEDNQ